MSNTTFNNLLIIGDPHVSSKRIGRRKPNYAQSVLEKLNFAAEKSLELKAYTVCLGDLFHFSGENNIALLHDLVVILKKFYHPLIVLEGNHDRAHFKLEKSDTLKLLALTDTLLVKGDGHQETVKIGDKSVLLSYVHHGMALPDAVNTNDKANYSIMFTHHDLAMGSAYPGAMPLKAIKGVDLVINGHMHKTERKKVVGSTWYQNPGNIEPLSIDLRKFIPKIWSWNFLQNDLSDLTPIDIPHDTDCFQLTGFHAPATVAVMPGGDATEQNENDAEITQAAGAYLEDDVPELEPSLFAEKLTQTLTAPKTEDASILEVDLKETLETGSYSEDTVNLFNYMLTKLQKELQSKQ